MFLRATAVAAAVWLLSAMPALAPVAGAADARLIAADAGAIRFVVEVPALVLVDEGEPGGALTPQIDGYDVVGAPGHPLLLQRIVSVAVPPAGAVRLAAQGAGAETREGVRLRRNERAAIQPQAAAAPPARLLEVSWLRNQRVARIAIAPLAYDATTGRLTCQRQVEVGLTIEALAGSGPLAEPNDPFEPIYRDLLINYEQGRAWRRPAHPGGATRARIVDQALDAGIPTTGVYGGRRWVKIAITKTGFYKVAFGQVRNTAVFGGDTTALNEHLRLFTWPGIPVLPETTYCDSCDYREVAIQFEDAGQIGSFGNLRDQFYFFAMGPSDWSDRYDPAQPDTNFTNHPYETRNYVYLTVDSQGEIPGPPRRIRTVPGTLGDPTGVPEPATFPERAHFEGDLEYFPNTKPNPFNEPNTLPWERWYWRSLFGGQSFVVPGVALPGIDSSQPVRVRLRARGLASSTTIRSPGVQEHYFDANFAGQQLNRLAYGYPRLTHTIDTLLTGVGAAPAVTVQVPSYTVVDPPHPERVDQSGFAWVDVFYQRRFQPVAGALAFDSPPGEYVYRIEPFDVGVESMSRVFDVTDPLDPIEVTDLTYESIGLGAWSMRFRVSSPDTRHYRVVATPGGIVSPAVSEIANAPGTSLRDLRDTALRADYLLIYYDGFPAAADSLRHWRAERLPLAGRTAPFDTLSVPISALYDQFSGGRVDPSAIRNFLRAASGWSLPPVFVTILGDASYDFKNIRGLAGPGQPGTLVPSYEGGYETGAGVGQYATDDWLLNVNDPLVVVPDFIGGRIPASDANAAMTYVRKLLAYERTAPTGEWRNRVMLIADDNLQGSRPDAIGTGHVRQTTVLDAVMPRHVDRVYEYLHTYPTPAGTFTKPGCKEDIIVNINGTGVVMANYIGHGSPFKLADETVLTDTDASAFVNGPRQTLLVAASCDVGKFNDPSVQSLGERLVLNPNGGAVGVVSATDEAFSGLNAILNRDLYVALFSRDTTTFRYFRTVSEALLLGKRGSANSQKYQVMGDAALRLHLPRDFAEISLEELDGTPAATLSRGGTYVARGRMLEGPGGAAVPFEGSVALLLEDSAPIETFCNGADCVNYVFRAAPIFRGDAAVSGGEFTSRFVVPMDAAIGPRARVRAYTTQAATNVEADGAGSLGNITLATGTPPADDVEGPRITLSFPGGSTSVRRDATLRVDLFDTHGILITGNVPQNGIIVTIDENSNLREEITTSFRYAANSYQSGTAYFRLPGLAPGPHTIRVSAADNLALGVTAAQHRSSASIAFEVTDNPALEVSRAFLMPSPTESGGPRSGGQFVIDAPGDAVNVLLRIYTVSGRLIRTLKSFGGVGQTQIGWDGLDDLGAPLANGIYLFRVHVNPREADGTSSPRQKAVAEGRFTIVNR